MRNVRIALLGLAVAALAVFPSTPAGASNDPSFKDQWGLARIGAEKAWTRTTGAGVRIGIVDTGVDLNHEDLAGKVVELRAREIVTCPISSGWRSTSRLRRLNSGNSSRNNTPWWAMLISPGVGTLPPPTMPASLIVWCGARNGRAVNSGSPGGSRPMAL